jgi:hypothetical protein
MTAVGPQGESRVPQAAQVAHGLTISWAAQVRAFQDRFFELGVGDLAIRQCMRESYRSDEGSREEEGRQFHISSDL